MTKFNKINDLMSVCLGCLEDIGTEGIRFGWHTACFVRAFGDTEMKKFGRLKSDSIGSIEAPPVEETIRTPQLQGVYPKYSFEINGENYICKIGKSGDYPILPLGEYVCNAIAHACGIEVNQFHLIWHANRPCFLTKNFISPTKPQTLVHLFHYWQKPKNPKDYPYNLCNLIEVVEKTGGPAAVISIVQLILFDYLIGNSDRHRSNIAFIVDANGTRLTPFYDNVTELALETEDHLDPKVWYHPSLKMDCEANSTEISDYIKDLKKIGLESFVKKFQKNLINSKKKIDDIIDTYPLTPNFQACFKLMVEKRFAEIVEAKI